MFVNMVTNNENKLGWGSNAFSAGSFPEIKIKIKLRRSSFFYRFLPQIKGIISYYRSVHPLSTNKQKHTLLKTSF